MQVKVVGLGGIGTHLIVPLCRYLSNLDGNADTSVTLIDGDEFDAKNVDRQNFTVFGNKAMVTAEIMRHSFPTLSVEAKPRYVTEENIFLFIKEGDLVFSCVDNHATRKLLSDYCQNLNNVVLISGGNEYSDGNIQVYVREDGEDVTPPITQFHPEIDKPGDRNPAELSCEELARSGTPQLIFTNFMVAGWMLSAFWLATKGDLKYSEQYFDLETGMTRSIKR